MSAAARLALIFAVAVQAVALTVALPEFHLWLAGAIGLADAVIAVVCWEEAS